MDEKEVLQRAIRRHNNLRTEYLRYVPEWKDIRALIYPWIGKFEDDGKPNQPRKDYMQFNSTPMHCANVAAAGLHGGITPRSRPWFRFTVMHEDLLKETDVANYLYTVQEITAHILAESNAYLELIKFWLEIVVFGIAAILIEQDFNKGISCHTFTCGEYMVAHDKDGVVNTFARKFSMTAIQMVERFGEGRVSHAVIEAYKDSRDTEKEFTVCCLIEPNDKRIPNQSGFRNMPYRSMYWEDGQSEKFLSLGGYEEFPVICSRWNVVGSEVYGNSPGWYAKNESSVLQEQMRERAEAVAINNRPPITAPNSLYGKNLIHAVPGGVTWVDSGNQEGIKPLYHMPIDIRQQTETILESEDRIKKHFFYDLLLMFSSDDRVNVTATEIMKRYEEKLQTLGTMLERSEAEILEPLLNRVGGILGRAGIFPNPPEILEGMQIKPEYTSVLTQAIKQVGISAIQDVAAFAGNLAGMFPEVVDGFNAVNAVSTVAVKMGVPPNIIRSPEEVAQIQAQRQQMQEAQIALQSGMQVAQGAKLLSETNISGQSALDTLLGGV